MTIKEISGKIESTSVDDLKLYFITRVLKENVKRSAKIMDKFLFNVYEVEIDGEVRKYLFDTTTQQLEKTAKKNFEIIDYDVISDDTEHLFSYSIQNKMFSFTDVVYNKLSVDPPKMLSLNEIVNDEVNELWAYCVGFNDVEKKDWIYTFRKIQPSKVAVDEKEGKRLLNTIRTYFNTTSQKLELLKWDTINLDKQIDCLYYEEIFYILKKANFEQIIGLQEEFKETSKEVVAELKATNKIIGLEVVDDEIENNPTIHKKLVRIAKIGNYRNIDDRVIKQMQRVCKKYGDNLKVKNGCLQIEEIKDVDVILKMLADYYKTGEVSGRPYGTYAGKELTNKVQSVKVN